MSEMHKVARSLSSKMAAYRRDFHRFAEAGWLEFRTASLAACKLEELGFQVRVGHEVLENDDRMGLPPEEEILAAWEQAAREGADPDMLDLMKGGFTAVVADFENGEGPKIGFRFDMDALYVNESGEKSHRPAKSGFASVHPGIMHACGHDGHTALGLGFAEALMMLKDSVQGSVRLIFQPAEEGVRGAKAMVSAGVVDDLDYVIAVHLYSGVDKGKVILGLGSGTATSKFDALITGAPGHAGGSPQSGKNALLAASTAVLNLFAIPRHADGATRINVGKLEAGTGRNVICPQARMMIETRGVTEELNTYMQARAMQVLEHAAEMYDCDLEIKQMGAAPVAASDDIFLSQISDWINDQGDLEIAAPGKGGGSEDFTYMMKRVQENGGKAVYLGLGADLGGWGHHTAEFDFDEDALEIGLNLLLLIMGKLQPERKA